MARSQSSQKRSNGTAEPTFDDLAAQIDELKADLAQLTGLMSDYAVAKKGELEEGARTKAREAGARARDEADAVAQSALRSYRSAEDAVRKEPAMAVGIAAGIGFLVGLVTARRG